MTPETIYSLLMMVAVFAIMYFIMIRPENKRKKAAEEMRSNLALGDEIVTIGGMTGKIVQITEETVTFETGEDRVRIQIKKWAIQTNERAEAKARELAEEKKRDRGLWFREMKSEMKKVVWPTRQTVLKNTGTVLLCSLLIGVCIWVFDFVASSAVEMILNVFNA